MKLFTEEPLERCDGKGNLDEGVLKVEAFDMESKPTPSAVVNVESSVDNAAVVEEERLAA